MLQHLFIPARAGSLSDPNTPATFRPSISKVEQTMKNRVRDIEITRDFLKGTSLESMVPRIGGDKGNLAAKIKKILTLTFYRSVDKTGLPKEIPLLLISVLPDAEMWLQKIEDNYEAIKLINNPNIR